MVSLRQPGDLHTPGAGGGIWLYPYEQIAGRIWHGEAEMDERGISQSHGWGTIFRTGEALYPGSGFQRFWPEKDCGAGKDPNWNLSGYKGADRLLWGSSGIWYCDVYA